MKKTLAIFLAALLLLSALAGCGGDKNPLSPAGGAEKNHVVDYKLNVPDGFEPTEVAGLDAAWFRADGSNINLGISPKDDTTDLGFTLITADVLRTTLAEEMKSTYGMEVQITDRYFTKDKVCGLTAYQYCYEMVLGGQAMMQLIVCINADKMYTFTFTAVDSATLAALEQCAKNIQLTLE